MHAEQDYLFRHALLRDAAYQLQLPGDRARLHGLAFAVLEDFCGGPPPDPPPLDAADPPAFRPHATDPFALELADHARATRGRGETLYLQRALEVALAQFQHAAAQEAALRLAALRRGPQRQLSARAALQLQTRAEAEALLRRPRHFRAGAARLEGQA